MLGTLSKPQRQRQRQREWGKTKGLMSRTMALHVYYKILSISLSVQNNNVKSLHSAYLRQRESRWPIFHVSIGK